MFHFDEDGFLTDRRGELEDGIRKGREALFRRAREINRDCHKLAFTAEPHDQDGREVLVLLAFIRALEHYQAAILMLGTALVAPAKVAIRAALEAVFTARALVVDEAALRAFITDDLIQRRKLIRKAKQHDHANLEKLRAVSTDELVRQLEEQIQEAGAKPLPTERLAELADMHGWYTTVYAMLSKAAHTHVRDLETYLRVDKNGKIRSLEYAPSLEEIPMLLLTAAHCLVLGGEAVSRIFGIAFEAKDEHLRFIQAQFAVLDQKGTRQ